MRGGTHSLAHSHARAQGRIPITEDMHWTRSILSGLFIIVTTVYGYILSHR